MKYMFYLIVMTLMGSVAAFCLKKASGSEGLMVLLKNRFLYYGGILYFLSALINIYLLRILPYSVVLPLTSITYIWTMAISYFALKEEISLRKISGVVLIALGVAFVAI
ncbi:EamA family transporter [Desulfitobacterium metallireducens]|uniref:Multidrug transporter n=1 Tax=Desulfitobacterium metallireducens DSM 15288 TaxID=871968 RepID=W0EFS4_9FIRM|nr:EamA family transporter [Desulfitobacterium metallireducens]AHF08059.1 multidrug transporter [Desulfitobacterium metallireducens DSM 15288]